MLHKYPNVVPIPDSKNKDRIIENLQGHRGHNESENSDFSKKWKNK